MKDCPICSGKYYQTELSENVCKLHEGWFVIVCSICGNRAFSDNSSMCIRCAGKCDTHFDNGFGKDHRFYLQMIGQEGKPTRGL